MYKPIHLIKLGLAILGLFGAKSLALANPSPMPDNPITSSVAPINTVLEHQQATRNSDLGLPEGTVWLSDTSYQLPDGTLVQFCGGVGPTVRWGW